MAIEIAISIFAVFLALIFLAWRRYLWAADKEAAKPADNCPYSLTDVFAQRHLANAPHQKGALWLSDIFSRSAAKFPNLIALQIPHTGESLSFAELDDRAEKIAQAISPHLNGPDQIVAVAMSQDNWQIIACHLAILKAGGTLMFLDTSMPDALITHMLNDAQPVLILTRGLDHDQDRFRDLPTLDVLKLPQNPPERKASDWLDDPTERLAAIFYTSGTTGMPKGVECPHAGYINLAESYADYFDLIPGMDATTLTSSLGYDGSITEMYSAWVSGCTVVMLTKEEVRSGPDLIPILCDAEVTVLFCPPVLLTTLTSNPEIDLPYPICRYIVPAGEAFPSALVEPWTRARRQIINTYGPTEASTDTSRQSLRPGEPVTIGSPFANVTYVILEVGQTNPLLHGEIGELCIGGVHVARGYRNLPEQTAEKFITHPEFGRLYRTGDKCKIDHQTQRVHFHGRIDAQLKVRGHRVEAQAVEDILQTQFSEIEAAVVDYQNQALIAFVTAPSILPHEIPLVAQAPTEWAERVTAILAKQLPEPSVPTKIYLVDKFVMKPVSGKIDRKCLPDLSNISNIPAPPQRGTLSGALSETITAAIPNATISTPVTDSNMNIDPVSDLDLDPDLDPDLAEVLEICRELFETPIGLDDGFADSGGHSILIARLTQRLQINGWPVTVRGLLSDCNTARKVANCPRHPNQTLETPATHQSPRPHTQSGSASSGRDEAAAEVLSIRLFTTLQVLFAAFLYSPLTIIFLGVFGFIEIGAFFTTADLPAFVAVGILLYFVGLVMPFPNLLWVMAVKYLMSGDPYKNNITPGTYPKWSKMHLRVWCIGRMENMVMPLGATFRSPPLQAFILRQLGANIGKNLQCMTDASLSGPLDLITIGDNVAVQSGAYIHTTRWSGEELHIGPVRLESGSKIGMRAAIANNVTVGEGSWICPFTPILHDVGSNEMWQGAPARLSGRTTELKRTAVSCTYSQPIWLLETTNILMQIIMDFFLGVLPSAVILWSARAFIPAGEASLSSTYFTTTPMPEIVTHLTLYAIITAWVSVTAISLLTSLFLRLTKASPGLYPSRGLKGAFLIYRMNKMNQIQGQWTWTITGQYLRALAGMGFPRVGASECDLMFNLIPELATADSQVFWSNGGFTNMLDYGAEHIKLRHLDMPRNFFSGNNSVAEHGHFPANFLLGVSTPASDIDFRRQMRSRPGAPITLAGNPPVKFASASFEDENETHALPKFPLFAVRIFLNDIFSMSSLRIIEGLLFTIIYIASIRLGGHAVISAITALIITEAVLIALSVTVKKLLIGRDWGTDHATAFWSWKHFAYFFAQDCFFVWCKGPLGFTAGTVLSNPILRWMGCKIGKRTIVTQPMQCSDWNAVDFGNDCVVDGFLQFHTFEDMTLKVKQTRIQDRCAVTFGATIMGGAVIEPDTTLMPLSMILKEMHAHTAIYEGSPAAPVLAAPTPQPIALGQSNSEQPELNNQTPINQPKPELNRAGNDDAK